ncbi:MAG: nitroreductase family protein [Lachnospiraceae bacterium]|nr:nitroreductase family protein [Lachnospiraceae bacterium]
MDNKLLELTLRRRSVRKYKNTKVDDAVIEEIMKVALTAPTSFGHKAVEFVAVREPEMILLH